MDWSPFVIDSDAHRKPSLRSWRTLEGLGDRMRIAAFAERQAVAAFTWAADTFGDVPDTLREAWRDQVLEEQLHHDLIVTRMAELEIPITEQPVSDRLYQSLVQCKTGRDFCIQIVAEEHRGLLAAKKLVDIVAPKDPATAAVFSRIAADEVAHVALADRFFGWRP